MRCKKTALLFILISVLLMCTGITAFADDEATFYIDETLESDNTVRAVVSFPQDISAAGTIRLNYNTDVLELISAKKGSMSAQMINVNQTDDGTIVINYLNAYGAISDNTELAVLTFSLKTDTFSADDIYSDYFALYDLDSRLLGDETTTQLKYSINTDNAPSEISVVSEVENSVKPETSADVSDKKESGTESSKSESFAQNSVSKAQEKSESTDSSKVVSDENSVSSEETSVSNESAAVGQNSSEEAVTTVQSKSVSEAVSEDISDSGSKTDTDIDTSDESTADTSSSSEMEQTNTNENKNQESKTENKEDESNSSSVLIIVILFISCGLIAFAVIRRQKRN